MPVQRGQKMKHLYLFNVLHERNNPARNRTISRSQGIEVRHFKREMAKEGKRMDNSKYRNDLGD